MNPHLDNEKIEIKQKADKLILENHLPKLIAVLIYTFLFIYIGFFGVNSPHADDWGYIQTYKSLLLHEISWLDFFKTQNNQNRMFFAYLAMLPISFVSSLNIKAFMYASALIQLASCILVTKVARRTLRADHSSFWWFLPIPIFLCSLIQTNFFLWGFQFAWFLISLCLIASLSLSENLLCHDITASTKNFITKITGLFLLGFIGSLSSIQGLIIWPSLFLFLLISRAQPGQHKVRAILLYSVAVFGAISTAIYFFPFNFNSLGAQQGGGELIAGLAKAPSLFLKFTLANIGGVFGIRYPNVAIALGLSILTLASFLLLQHARKKTIHKQAFAIALISFGLIFDLLFSAGRSPYGIPWALQDFHASPYNLILICGAYLLWVGSVKEQRLDRLKTRISVVASAVIIIAFSISSTYRGFEIAAGKLKERSIAAYLLTHQNEKPSFLLDAAVGLAGNHGLLERQLDFLRNNSLTIFSITSPSYPWDVRFLINRPAEYYAIAYKHPELDAALTRMWDIYTIHFDLQRAFPLDSASLLPDLIHWFKNNADSGSGYENALLSPYGEDYKQLFNIISE